MNFALDINLRPEFRLVVPDSTFTEILFESVEKNRSFVQPYVDWIRAITNKKETQYVIERNLRAYKELIGKGIDASHHSGFSFFIIHNQKCVGMTGFQGISLKNRICALGYWIDQDYQGKGLITEANQMVIDYAFDVLDLNRIEIQCAVDNISSINVAKRLEFKEEATLRQVEKRRDKFVNHLLFSKLASER